MSITLSPTNTSALTIEKDLSFQAPYIVGIAGGTASGKTRLVEKIMEVFSGQAVLIEQDAYYKDISHLSPNTRARNNFDHPDSIDFALLKEHLEQLKEGNPIQKPIYSFINQGRTLDEKMTNPAKVIIVEGILVLAVEEVRKLLDLKIFVEAEDDTRILRRIKRDIAERGCDLEGVITQYHENVKPMHNQFVGPSRQHANLIIPSTQDTSVAEDVILAKLKEVVDQ